MEVTLSPTEAAFIEVVSGMRHSMHLHRVNTAKLTTGRSADGRDEDAIGCYGEYVAARVLDVSWQPFVKDPWALPADIARVGQIEVRTSFKPSNTHLILYKDKDPISAQYVFVRRLAPYRFSVDGWVPGEQGMKGEYWRDDVRSPALFVPRSAFSPIEELWALVTQWREDGFTLRGLENG